jgi:rhamnulose-1-phosphate aldolase/alcohol dehydrogenase
MAMTTATFPIQRPVLEWRPPDGAGELELLTYRSNLLGTDRSVANWGGGNTSCKATEMDFRARPTRVLWVKGSGSDLATIRANQFTGLRLEDVEPLFDRQSMSDEELVAYYEHATLKPHQPRASIETPMHSMLPFAHIDHTHPDAIIAVCAVPSGPDLAQRLWGRHALWVPYQRPGFGLGKLLATAVRDHPELTCVLLAKHGLVTWGDSAEECFRSTVDTIGRAAEALAEHADEKRVFAAAAPASAPEREVLLRTMTALRGAVSARQSMVLYLNASERARAFACRPDLSELASVGPACPDHLVHTRPWPLVLAPDASAESIRSSVQEFEARYASYVERHGGREQMLNPAPRVVLAPGLGVITSGADATRARVSSQLYERAMAVLSVTAGLGGFGALTEAETFGIEYWPMELYKLSLQPPPRELAGRVALVTGGASGIGRSIVQQLAAAGAHVVVADRNISGAEDAAAELVGEFGQARALAVAMDVTDEAAVRRGFEETVLHYGGLDIMVSNAGLATSNALVDTSLDEWNRTLDVLGTGYFLAAREAFRIMQGQARGGSIVFVASKNGLVAGRNAAAYSAAKALEIHLARCLAEEGGASGIRVNTVNPDAVLQGSGIWSSSWREQRAQTYGIRPDQLEEHYRSRTTLKVNVFPENVAEAVVFLASDRSSKSTGNIINVDGGVAAAYTR